MLKSTLAEGLGGGELCFVGDAAGAQDLAVTVETTLLRVGLG
jgi:hypothetical protein